MLKRLSQIWDLSHLESSEELRQRWCMMRAMEWGRWPIFVSQPIVPILFIFVPWWQVLVGLVIASWVWAIFRWAVILPRAAEFGAVLVQLRWPVSIVCGIYLAFQSRYGEAALATFWPFAILLLFPITPRVPIGKMELAFREALGMDEFPHPE